METFFQNTFNCFPMAYYCSKKQGNYVAFLDDGIPSDTQWPRPKVWIRGQKWKK